jgi:phosphomannomutase
MAGAKSWGATKIAIGGEESTGLSIRYHVPEKDGILAGLLCCEMVARRRKSLGQQTEIAVCRSWFLLPLARELPIDAGGQGEVY